MNIRNLREDLQNIAKAAGNLLLEERRLGPIKVTAWKDFVTSADLASDRLITMHLQKLHPDIPILSEESGGVRQHQGRQFIVDPVDGTNNFARRFGRWSVSIGAINDNQTEVAVVRDPERECTFYAVREEAGAWCQHDNGDVERLHVGNEVSPSLLQSHIWTDWTKGDKARTLETLGRLVEHCTYPRIAMCATQSLIMVATGQLEGYVHPAPAPEDIAAAALLVEKAGGSVTTLSGEPWSPFSPSIVATVNQQLHGEVLRLLA
jgi:fructose-1,6-bisphosphatase/inositol monophosphatase family enzyme